MKKESNRLNHLWMALSVIFLFGVSACASPPGQHAHRSTSTSSTRCDDTSSDPMQRCWIMLSAAEDHLSGHQPGERPHVYKDWEYRFTRDTSAPRETYKLAPPALGRPSDVWSLLSLVRPTASQIEYVNRYLVSTDLRFCDSKCFIGALTTARHGGSGSGRNQIHMVLFDVVDELPKQECKNDVYTYCMQMELFCYGRDCEQVLPEDVDVNNVPNSGSGRSGMTSKGLTLLPDHKGTAHSGSGD